MARAWRAAGYQLADGTWIITALGLVDGRDVSVDGLKLDGIEALADVTDEGSIIAGGGAILAGFQEWTKAQRAEREVLTSTAGAIAYDVRESNDWYHDIDEAAAVGAPDNVVAGMRWSILVEANGTHELTWHANYDWGNDGTVAPVFAGMANGDLTVIDFYAATASVIMAAASRTTTP